MNVSTMSDCVIMDNTIPTIALDESQDNDGHEVESGEDVSQDGIPEEDPTTKYVKHKLMNIHFPDESSMQKFGPELIEFMQQKCLNLAVELDNSGLEISFFEKIIDLEEDEKDRDSPMFTIDSTPSKGKPAAKDVPRYNQSISETLSNEKEAASGAGGTSGRRAMSCFNCDGEHNLRDCTEPRNHQRINANRKSRLQKSERYHVDLSQKYGHLAPGKISSRLQKALGLRSKDLPVHIFRMRKLGYPPGWLHEARVSHSGINLFGSDGTIVLESEDEDGEVEQVKDKYDPTKVIEYPGFNVDAPEESYDDAKMFNCPPMQEEHRKENFLANLGVNLATAYKRRKMNSFPMNDSDVQAESVDMEIVPHEDDDEDGEIKDNGGESAPPLPVDDNAMPPPPVPEEKTKDGEGVVEEASPALVNDSLVEFILTRDEEEEIGKPTDSTSTTAATPVTSETVKPLLVSKEVIEGTPLLKSASPFDKLPDGDKWSVGVSDVINFENLPDSTGKYEKMKVLIKKVQTELKQINSE